MSSQTDERVSFGDQGTRDDEMHSTITEWVDDLADLTDDAAASEQFQEWLDVQSRFHDYSYRNTLLIKAQCPEATKVAGYHTWQSEFDRHVTEGESAIWIWAPIVTTRCPECENAPSYHDQIDCEYDETSPMSGPRDWSDFGPRRSSTFRRRKVEPFPNSTPKQPATLATSSPNSSRQPVISASTFGSSRSASGRTVTRRACASTTETVVHQSSKSRRLRTTPIWRQPSSTSTLTHCFTTSSTTRRSVRSEKSRPKQSPTSPDDTSTWTRATRRSTSRRETGTTVILSPTDSVVSAGQPNESSTQLGNNDERRQYYKDSAES